LTDQQSDLCLSDSVRGWATTTPGKAAVISAEAKETVLEEIIGRPLHDQTAFEAMWGYALGGGNTTVMDRSQQFFDKVDRGRAGYTATPL
jgi:hypothetical protein